MNNNYTNNNFFCFRINNDFSCKNLNDFNSNLTPTTRIFGFGKKPPQPIQQLSNTIRPANRPTSGGASSSASNVIPKPVVKPLTTTHTNTPSNPIKQNSVLPKKVINLAQMTHSFGQKYNFTKSHGENILDAIHTIRTKNSDFLEIEQVFGLSVAISPDITYAPGKGMLDSKVASQIINGKIEYQMIEYKLPGSVPTFANNELAFRPIDD